MKSKYNILGDVYVLEPTNESWDNFPSSKKAPSKHYENHLQKIEGGYIRYCYYDVKINGKKYYGRRALIIPENTNVELHLKALMNGVLNPELWEPFAQNILKYTRAHGFDEVQPYTPARDIDKIHPLAHIKKRNIASLKEFLKNALIPWSKNPGWNIDALLVIGGFVVWAIVVIGNAFGKATIPLEVTEIGKAAFYAGLGRASIPKNT